MKIFRNRYLPLRRYEAMNLCGLLFCRPDATITPQLINHERIHSAQQRELLFIVFFIWYVAEWLIRLPMRGRAYRNISFEREAYCHMHDPDYLSRRRKYAWLHYLRNDDKKA